MSWSVFLVILSAGITFGEYVNGIQNDFNIKAEFAKLAQRVDALETDKTAQADKIRVLETDKATQANKIRVLETDKATQANKIRVLETDKAAQADKIRVLETDKAAQADKIRVLETDKATQADKIRVLETDKAAQADKIRVLETDKATQADKIRVLETDKTAQADKIRVLETDKAAQADKIRVLETDKATQADKIRVLETDKAVQADKIRVLEQETGELRVKHQESLHMIEDLKSEIKQCGQTFGEPATDGKITAAEKLENFNHTEDVETTSGKRENENVQLMRVVPKTKDEQKAGPSIRTKGQDKRRQLTDGTMQIAFTAFITPSDYGPLGQNQVLKFDHVVTNIGNAYHPHSGTFIVPVDGVYMFFATIAGEQYNNKINYARILVNGSRVTEMLMHPYEQSSQLIILSLRTNDEVFLINMVANDMLLGGVYSSFSGVLLSPA